MRKHLILSFTLLLSGLFANADPCTSIDTLTCGTPVTFNTIGAGDPAWDNGSLGSCNKASGSGGGEKNYQFTAPGTGYYQFQILSISGGYVDFYWKNTSLGCNTASWNCVGYSQSA